ncbi:MAG TPA: nuclear transport factor 2 family protein [Solirubrobacterales bacterium]
MSEENVELVRRGYEHFARTGEADASVYSLDVEWHSAGEDPYSEPFHGIEGVRRLIREVRDSLDDFRTEPFEYLDAGDFVVAGLIHRGRGKGSAAEVEMREWNVFLVRGGKIQSVHEYSDRESFLRAAGLNE